MRRAVFLDRDGTLIEDRGYPCRYDRGSLFPFTPPALRLLRECGFLLVVVTNQSCVARGLCTPEQVETFHHDLRLHLDGLGAGLDAVYACYAHEQGTVPPWNVPDPRRKPAPGMMEQAARDLEIDLTASFLIGDKRSDIGAGRNAGCRTVLVRTGYGRACEADPGPGPAPDFVADDLLAAARFIAAQNP